MPEMNGLVPYRTKTVVLAAGEIRSIPGRVKFILLLSATNLSGVALSFNGGSFSAFPPGLSVFGFDTDNFWVKNTSVAQNTIVLAVGESEIRDSRVTLDAANPLPVSLTGTPSVNVVGGDSLQTDSAKRLKTRGAVAQATSATILSLQTSVTGANFVTFSAQACDSLDLINTTGTAIEYRRGGAGNTVVVPTNASRLIVGLANANEISLRRVDNSNTTVTLKAEAIVV
jgi:hypothetical protein